MQNNHQLKPPNINYNVNLQTTKMLNSYNYNFIKNYTLFVIMANSFIHITLNLRVSTHYAVTYGGRAMIFTPPSFRATFEMYKQQLVHTHWKFLCLKQNNRAPKRVKIIMIVLSYT